MSAMAVSSRQAGRAQMEGRLSASGKGKGAGKVRGAGLPGAPREATAAELNNQPGRHGVVVGVAPSPAPGQLGLGCWVCQITLSGHS